MPDAPETDITDFISRWSASGGRERANYQLFLAELCDLLDLPHPQPAQADASENGYTFDRAITHHKADGSSAPRYIDLYKAGHFVLETKQGVEAAAAKADSTGLGPTPNPLKSALGHGTRGTAGYDKAMTRAHAQAEGYIRDLPAGEGRPPFLIVCDIGYVFELYAEFTVSGGRYQRFPDPKNHRIYLDDLRKAETRDLLRTIWTDPLSLDPAKRIAKVTRDIADRLARLAKSLEAEKHDPEVVAVFLQRCLFTMFAEDIGLLPEHGFLELLKKVDENPASFPTLVTGLWNEMSTGTDYSTLLFQKIAQFNGGLFENASALPLTREQVQLLIEAAQADWTEVDPAIFGTLLERALDPRERHKLGAHYTPRSYVERLIEPTVIEPLRTQWESVKAAAVLLMEQEKTSKAREEVESYHHELCQLKILDPACGSGNFLYVTMEHLKLLEAEVLDFFELIGGNRTLEMDSFKVRPDQFFGMELNRSAVSIAQLVLWIGYFQWHFRTTGKADTNDRPLLPKQNTILHQDAVLAYDEKIPRRDEEGNVVQIWDGITTKPHPVTGKEVPDESAKKVLYDFTNPRRPDWPEADYVVGNPPFVGASRMRDFLGHGYTEAVSKAWKGDVPESADFVMYWWEKSAQLLRDGKIKRFGLITTNSIHQTFNRRVLERHLGDEKKPMHLAFAIPDHPWVDSSDGAAVRIAMTVGSANFGEGMRLTVSTEAESESGDFAVTFNQNIGSISSSLRLGANLASKELLQSNEGLSCPGVKLHGSGFLIDSETANKLGLGRIPGIEKIIREYRNGKDLTTKPRGVHVIDLFGLSSEKASEEFPETYQHVLSNVKPERDQNRRATYRDNWWIFGEPRSAFRPALVGLDRYIATVETSKYRFFVFLDGKILPDNKLIAFADESAVSLGVMSSHVHVAWSLANGSQLGPTPVYVKTTCFETFPFPDPDEPTRERIRELGERLDAHRKRQQSLHPDLTLTGIYNVLEALRAGTPLTPKERKIHDDGLVSVLQQIHDDLDEAVFHAYGWDDLWAQRPTVHSSAGSGPLDLTLNPDLDPEAAEESTIKNKSKIKSGGGAAADAWENELLERLVALNHERAEEEKNGKIRWLRPDFQNPDGDSADGDTTQSELALPAAKTKAAPSKAKALAWPDRLPDQVTAIRTLLPDHGPDSEALSAAFGRKSTKREEQVSQVLEVLESLGQLQ